MKINKYYFLIICLISITNYTAYSQCFVTAKALYQGNVFTDTVEVCQGSNLMLFTEDSCNNPNCGGVILQEDFNNMTLGNGWSSTFANPVFNNPCQCPFINGLPPSSCTGIPGQFGPDGAFAWVGTTASNERTLITQSYNLTPFIATGGCKIKFWMMFGITPNSGSCEDPDEAAEGVHLQYSVNNGTTWTDFPGPNTYPIGNLSPTPPFNTITPGSGGY